MPAYPKTLVDGGERSLYTLIVVLAALIVLGTIGFGLLYFLGAFVFGTFGAAWLSGTIRGNAVRVTEHQYTDLHRMSQCVAEQLGMSDAPAIYVLQQGGLLNALAARVLSRRYVVLYSDLAAVARDGGADAVEFVVAHEYAHHLRNHVHKSMFFWPMLFIPFLGSAYSRACERTCDGIATWVNPDGAEHGIALLAAGPVLYRELEHAVFAEQVSTEGGFWVRLVELLSTHPTLPRRMSFVRTVRSSLPTAVAPPVLTPAAVTMQ